MLLGYDNGGFLPMLGASGAAWLLASNQWDDDALWIDSRPFSAPAANSDMFIATIANADSKASVDAKLVALIDRYNGYLYSIDYADYGDVRAALNTMATALSLSTIGTSDTGSTIRTRINAIITALNPSLVFDLENSFYYWGGATKTLADGSVTNHGDGSYTVTDGSWWASTHTMLVEYTLALDTNMSGSLFTWTNASNQRMELTPYINEQTALYESPPGNYTYPAPVGVTGGYHSGRRRVAISLENNQTPLWTYDAGTPSALTTTTPGTFTTPSKFCVGRNARFNNGVLANATIKRVTVWPRTMPAARLRGHTVISNYAPVHFLGDSFLNNGALQEQILHLCAADYIAFSQDGVGGSSITQQAARFALTPDHHNSTLVIMDGGFDGTSADAITAINDITGRLPHNNWYYVQPNPISVNGDSGRTTWDAAQAAILAHVGAAHYITTLAELQAENDGGGTDLADVANGIWPTSMRSDSVHLSAAGNVAMAQIIYDFVSADGLLP